MSDYVLLTDATQFISTNSATLLYNQLTVPSLQQITHPAKLESLALFRELIQDFCQDINVEVLYDIQLAVDEICTNIILHGYKDMEPASITLKLEFDPAEIKISITDTGHPFQPKQPPDINLHATAEEREIGGLGLSFVFMSVDDLQYESTASGNITRLLKKI